MSKVRVPIAGTIGKSVRVNPDATEGATIGTDLKLADGSTPTFDELVALIGAALGASASTGTDDVADFYLEVAKGNVAGHSLTHKFGANEGIPNGGAEIVSSLSISGLGIFLAAASTVRIKAGGNAADDVAGAGAREVTVQGIDDSFNEVTETIDTAGASVSSATTTSFWRVHRAWVSEGGTNNASNTGNIVIENSGGTQDLLQIDAGYGQSLHAVYTSPTGYDMYLLSVVLTADSNAVVDFSLFKRENIADVTPEVEAHRMQNYWDGVEQQLVYKPVSPVKISDVPCDLWVEAYGDGNPASVSANMEILLVAQ